MRVSNKTIAIFVAILILFQLLFIIEQRVLYNYQNSEKNIKLHEITGKATDNGNVFLRILRPPSDCNFDVAEGWNFFSLCADANDKTVTNILDNIDGDYDYVLRWNNTIQDFMLYSIYAAENDFDSLDNNASYFVSYTGTSGTIDIAGDEFEDLNLSVGYEWDAPMYPYQFETNISKYLATIDEQYTYVLKWNHTVQDFMLYSIYAAENPFETIDLGEGQFIFITNTSGTVLRYNKSGLQ